MATGHSEVEVLTPPAATCDAVITAISGARLVHLACHGVLRSDSPTFSSFQMADGPLTVYDLQQLDRPAHHWVLASCDLGSPGRLAGPDLEGVLASLIAGGAAGVVAAVVPVPDEATVSLMETMHHRLRAGDTLPEALRRSSDSIDGSDPHGLVVKTAFACYGGG